MVSQERVNKLKELSDLLSRNQITWHDWQLAVQNENEDFNAGVVDSLPPQMIHSIYRLYNVQFKRIKAHITLYLEMNGGRVNPIQKGYRPHLVFDNKQQSDGQFIFDDVIYPGDDWMVDIELLNNVDTYSGLIFGIYEGNKKVGHGAII